MAKRVVIDGSSLTIDEIDRVARAGAKVALSGEAKRRVRKCKKWCDTFAGRGDHASAATQRHGKGETSGKRGESETDLEKWIIHAHVAGTGTPLPNEAVRAAILCRINSFAKGIGGVGPTLLETLIELLNRGITPLMHEKGLVGTTGAMAQVAEVLTGSGEAYYRGELLPSAFAMKKAGLDCITPNRLEGANLINGTHVMAGGLALCCVDARNLLTNAMIASAMTIDALRVSRDALGASVQALRPYRGQGAAAEAILRVTAGSTIGEHERGPVPDAYSLQCTHQILGPSLDALAYVTRQIEIEINAVSDDYLFFAEKKTRRFGGHAHGQPIAMAADFLAIAVAEAASLGERHVNRLLNPALSGLPAFLVDGEGPLTGLAAAQQTAASLVSGHKVLAHPGVVDSISISADREDHVSMGPVSVGKLRTIISQTTTVIAVEMLCAAQALDLLRPRRAGKGVRAAYRTIRSHIPRLDNDRPLYPDIRNIEDLIDGGAVVRAVERAVGPLEI